MRKIYDNVLLLYILVICMHFVITRKVDKSESAYLTDNSSSDSKYKQFKYKQDDFIDYSHEHIAARKWRENDAHARQMCEKLYNYILPHLSNSSNDLDLSPGCKRALIKTLVGVKNYKLWAFKMLDSSGKIPIGMLNLDGIAMGNYDECLAVGVPGYFRGQYCTVMIKPPLPKRERFTKRLKQIPEFENHSRSVPEDSVSAELYRISRLFYFRHLRIGVCTPSTCTKEEVKKLANTVLQSLKINVDVHVTNCDVREENFKLGGREISILSILGLLLFVGIASTTVDVYLKLKTTQENYKDNLSLPIRYLLCFSFYSNTKRLIAPDSSPDTIEVLNGIRVITTLWIILGHTYSLPYFPVTSYFKNAFHYLQDISFSLVVQGYMAVDAFFFMSSVLHSYAIMKQGDKKINYALRVFKRIARVLIPFLFVLACVFLVPYLGSGPEWKEMIEKHFVRNCRLNWWKNILFINNFFHKKEMCLSFSWYISADTHLFLLSLLVVIPMRRNPRHAFAMISMIFLGGISLSEYFRYYYGTATLQTFSNIHLDDMSYVKEVEYYSTYEHCSSCCVGLIVGYFLAKRSNNLKISLRVNVLLWLSAFIIFICIIIGPYSWNVENVPNVVLCVLYKSTKRLWWSLALGWVTIACHTGNAGVIKDILSWPVFVPLARLTYMVYLLHKIILYMYFASARSAIEYNHRTVVYIYIGTVVISYVCAYCLGLLFEMPFLALQSLALSSHASKGSSMHKRLKCIKEDINEETEDSFNDPVNLANGNCTDEIKKNGANDYGSLKYRKFL